MATHIGKKIEEQAAIQNLAVAELSERLNTTRKNIYNIFNREIIDSSLLLACCKVLDHDFFQYYYDFEPLLKYKQAYIKQWQDKLDAISESLEKAEYALDVQKELTETQRQLLIERDKEIALLKNKR